MVIPVKEDQFLLPQNNEGGVSQLWNLGGDEEPSPEGGDLVSGEITGAANGLLDAAVDENVYELRQSSREADDGEGRQGGAPGRERRAQLERSARVHESLP